MLNSELIYKIFHERHFVQRKLARGTFNIWQLFGFHLVGDHFYDPIPNTHLIKRDYKDEPRELPGIGVDWRSFVEPACDLMDLYVEEWLRERDTFGYHEKNTYFQGIDALYYYSFIRQWKPRKIIEIGQGSSTRTALAAMSQNARTGQNAPELISVDPYRRLLPSEISRNSGVILRFIEKTLQEITDIPFMLQPGDLLFIDSNRCIQIRK